jgi:hypothetical protein
MSSELHRFGFNDDGDDSRWKKSVEGLLKAIVTNPFLNIGSGNSEVVFPSQMPAGRSGATGGGATSGAFFSLITIESGDATNGDIYLQGGQVTAGTGSEFVANYLLYDASADTWAGSNGQHLSIRLNGTGSEADDVLLPTFDMTSLSGPTVLTPPLPDNDLPEIGSLAGECVVSLGIFTDAGFFPALPGNIQASFCFGGFTVSRF